MKKPQNATSPLFKVTGDWSKQSKLLQGKFPKLTNDDLKFETGKEISLLNRIGAKLDKTRPQVISMLNDVKPV